MLKNFPRNDIICRDLSLTWCWMHSKGRNLSQWFFMLSTCAFCLSFPLCHELASVLLSELVFRPPFLFIINGISHYFCARVAALDICWRCSLLGECILRKEFWWTSKNSRDGYRVRMDVAGKAVVNIAPIWRLSKGKFMQSPWHKSCMTVSLWVFLLDILRIICVMKD